MRRRPFVWNGIDVGGKMAVVKLNDGSLWVHSPVALDAALADELAQARPPPLPPVCYIPPHGV
jgi:hypothetical protein